MRRILLGIVALISCEGHVDGPVLSRNGRAGSIEEELPRSADRTFRLAPMGILPGQTNMPTSALMPFSFAGALHGATRSLIESQSYFVGPADVRTSVKVIDLQPQRASDLATLQLHAAVPLAPDTWYWLIVEQTADLRVAGAEKQQQWKTHFFTGSAPRVVRLQASTAKNPDILNITFSEPVNAATLSAPALYSGGGASGTCVLRGGGCLDQSQPFLTNNVDLRLNAKFVPADAAVFLVGGVSGLGRSVAAAQGLTGDPYSGGTATLVVPASAWRICDGPTTYCWEDAKPISAAP